MRAPEYLPLVMEPESRFYSDPVIVLDFQVKIKKSFSIESFSKPGGLDVETNRDRDQDQDRDRERP